MSDDPMSVPVRVLPGRAVQTSGSGTPWLGGEVFTEGTVIPNLEMEDAARLVAAGVVEVTRG